MDFLVTTSLREKAGRFYAVFYDPDRGQKWRTLRTSDRREASKRLRIVEDLVSRMDYDPWESPVPDRYATLRGAADAYLAEREKSQLSPRTLRSDRSLLGVFCDHYGPAMKVRWVTAAKAREFFDDLVDEGRSDNTLRTYHVRLSHFFKWCAERRLVRKSPMAGVPRPSVGDTVPRFLSHAEFDALVAAVYSDADEKSRGIVNGEEKAHVGLAEGHVTWAAEVFFVAVETGMRRGELCAMGWSWVDFHGLSIWIPSNKRSWSDKDAFSPKSGKGRRIPIGRGSATEEVLRRLYVAPGGGRGPVFKGVSGRKGTGEGLNGTYLTKRFKYYCERAGLSEDYTFHTLRHTCASWMVMAGRHLVEVKEILGHASIDTTVRWYAHLDPARLNAAADATFGANTAKLRFAKALSVAG